MPKFKKGEIVVLNQAFSATGLKLKPIKAAVLNPDVGGASPVKIKTAYGQILYVREAQLSRFEEQTKRNKEKAEYLTEDDKKNASELAEAKIEKFKLQKQANSDKKHSENSLKTQNMNDFDNNEQKEERNKEMEKTTQKQAQITFEELKAGFYAIATVFDSCVECPERSTVKALAEEALKNRLANGIKED